MMTEESGTCQHNSFVIEAPNVYKKTKIWNKNNCMLQRKYLSLH